MPPLALVIALALCHSVQGTTPGNFFGVRYGKKYDKVLETHNGVSDPFSCVTLCVKNPDCEAVMMGLGNGQCGLVAPAGADILPAPHYVIYYKLTTSDLDARNKQTVNVEGSSSTNSVSRMSVVTQNDELAKDSYNLCPYDYPFAYNNGNHCCKVALQADDDKDGTANPYDHLHYNQNNCFKDQKDDCSTKPCYTRKRNLRNHLF